MPFFRALDNLTLRSDGRPVAKDEVIELDEAGARISDLKLVEPVAAREAKTLAKQQEKAQADKPAEEA